MKLYAALVLSIAISVGVRAAPTPSLVISFDDHLHAVAGDRIVEASLDGKPELAPGRIGKALKSGPDTGYVQYPTEGIISAAGGTVEMWVKAVDWKPEDEEFHVFFESRGEGALYLYKYYQGVRLLMLTCENVNGPYTSSAFSLDGWKTGEWHHIAGTWSAEGVLAYADGKPAAKLPAGGLLPLSLGKTFRIGDHPWHIARKTTSLIDEVRIYDRPLSSNHIAAHFQGNYDFTVPLQEDLTRLMHTLDPEKGEIQLRVTTGGADVEDARVHAWMAMVRSKEPLPNSAKGQPCTQGQIIQTFPLLSDKPGEYDLVAEVLLDGKRQFELRKGLTIPSMEWRGNRVGMHDKVLPPWTALQMKGNTVACWGRTYDYTASALPVQIQSANAAVLSRPVSLDVDVAGQKVNWSKQSSRMVSSTATRAEMIGELEGQSGAQQIRVATKVVAEYDGMLLTELSCKGGDGLPIDRVSLEIPVNAGNALYRHRYAHSWEGPAGLVPDGDGVVDKSAFIPYVWLGDNDRGLFWFCESDEFWPNGDSGDAIEIVRNKGEIVMRFNLLSKGQKLPKDWKWTFGLQATPVKPVPKDWRKWRLDPGVNPTVRIIWPTPEDDSMKYYGYPEATKPDVFSQRIKQLQEQGMKTVPYVCLSFISAACPEWPFFQKQWALGGADTGSSDVARYGAPFAIASPVGKEYADFIVRKTKQFIDQYGIDGVYHDNTHPYSSTRLDAGCGYIRDGKLRPTYPIVGFRNLYRRMYAAVKSLPKETFTMAHMSGKVTIPILAYDDSYLDGEHFRGKVKDSYLDLITLDTFRAEFMGRQWGIMPYFNPEFDAEHAQQVEPTRGMMALLMIHDVSPWPISCNVSVVNEAFSALDKFGYVDAEFIPYFDATPPAITDMKDVYISAYKRDGRALLIVSNLSKEDRKGNITINANRLGVPGKKLITWPDELPLTAVGGQVTLDIPRLGYRMVVVE